MPSNKRRATRCRSEAAIVRDILAVLVAAGAKAIKTTPPGVEAGTPDILACYRGRFIAIEVKRPGEEPTRLQLHRMAQWRAAGAVAVVLVDANAVHDLLAKSATNYFDAR